MTSTGNITGTAASLTIPGTSSFTTSGTGTITLTNASNDFTGGITLASGTGAIQITDSTATVLGASTLIGGDLTVSSGGGITQTGALTAVGAVSLSSSAGSITISQLTGAGGLILDADGTNSDININNTVTVTTGSATLTADDAIIFSASGVLNATGAGNVSLTANTNISNGDNGDNVDMTSGSSIDAGSGTITLVSTGASSGSILLAQLTTTSSSNAAVTLTVGNTGVTGNITDNNAGSTNVSAVNGRLVIVAKSGVGSANALEVTVGSVNIVNTNSNSVNLDVTGGLSIANITSANQILIIATGAITQTGAFTASGANGLSISTTGAVTLANTSNSVNTVSISTTSGDISFFNNGGFTVNTLNAVVGVSTGGGSVNLAANTGNIIVDQNISATTGVTLLTSAAASTITINTGDTVTSSSSGGVSITTDDLILAGTGAISASGQTVTINRSTSGTLGLGATAGGMSIDNTELGLISATSFNMGSSGTISTITVDGISKTLTGTLTLTASSDVLFNTGATTISTGNLAVVAGGDITQDINLSVGGTSSFTVTGSNGITLTNISNTFTGAVTLSSGTGLVHIVDSGTLILAATTLGGSLIATAISGLTLNGDLTTGGSMLLEADADNISTGTLTLASGITLTANSGGSITLDATTGGIIASGTATLNAQGGIDVNDNFTSSGALTINADSDDSGVGDLTVASGVTVATGNNSLTFHGADIDFTAATLVDAGTAGATLSFTKSTTATGANLIKLAASSLTVNVTGDLTVNGVTFSELSGLSGGLVTLTATDDVIFKTAASSHIGAVTVEADDDIEMEVDVTSGGDFKAEADHDKNTVGKFVVDSGVTVESTGGNIDITAAQIEENGTLKASGTITRTETNPATTVQEEIDQATNSTFLTDFTAPADTTSGC